MSTKRYFPNPSLYLLGIGAAAGGVMGMYLYRSPRLRTKLRNAHSLKAAATLFTQQIGRDSADIAHTVMASISENIAGSLQQTRRALGRRFFRKGRDQTPARVGMKQLKNDAKHIGRTINTEARHSAETILNEAARIKDEAAEARDVVASTIRDTR